MATADEVFEDEDEDENEDECPAGEVRCYDCGECHPARLMMGYLP